MGRKSAQIDEAQVKAGEANSEPLVDPLSTSESTSSSFKVSVSATSQKRAHRRVRRSVSKTTQSDHCGRDLSGSGTSRTLTSRRREVCDHKRPPSGGNERPQTGSSRRGDRSGDNISGEHARELDRREAATSQVRRECCCMRLAASYELVVCCGSSSRATPTTTTTKATKPIAKRFSDDNECAGEIELETSDRQVRTTRRLSASASGREVSGGQTKKRVSLSSLSSSLEQASGKRAAIELRSFELNESAFKRLARFALGNLIGGQVGRSLFSEAPKLGVETSLVSVSSGSSRTGIWRLTSRPIDRIGASDKGDDGDDEGEAENECARLGEADAEAGPEAEDDDNDDGYDDDGDDKPENQVGEFSASELVDKDCRSGRKQASDKRLRASKKKQQRQRRHLEPFSGGSCAIKEDNNGDKVETKSCAQNKSPLDCKLIGPFEWWVRRLVSSCKCVLCPGESRLSLAKGREENANNDPEKQSVVRWTGATLIPETVVAIDKTALQGANDQIKCANQPATDLKQSTNNCLQYATILTTSASMNEVKKQPNKRNSFNESKSVSLQTSKYANQLSLAPIEPRREFVSSAHYTRLSKSLTLHPPQTNTSSQALNLNGVVRATDLMVGGGKKVIVQSMKEMQTSNSGKLPAFFYPSAQQTSSSKVASNSTSEQISEPASILMHLSETTSNDRSHLASNLAAMDPKVVFATAQAKLSENAQLQSNLNKNKPITSMQQAKQQWQPTMKAQHSVNLAHAPDLTSLKTSSQTGCCCKINCKQQPPSYCDDQRAHSCKDPQANRPIESSKMVVPTTRQLGSKNDSNTDENFIDDDRLNEDVDLSAFSRKNNDQRNQAHKPGGSDIRPLKQRENWSKNIEFLLAVIGFAVDLGNVWRFPYICYRNGGGAFLIPYTIMFILGGLPIFYLEMSLGQYFSSGCLTVWRRVCPMAKGIGYAMCVLNFFTGLYYNTIISWAVFFFVESFATILPWTSCDNSWNLPTCRTIEQRQDFRRNVTTSGFVVNSTTGQHFTSPTSDYFEREVLQIDKSTGIDDLGNVRKPLAIYLAIVFVCIYLAIWKGVKSTGKAVWITALLPYFVLIPLLVRGMFLEGAWVGIKYYLYPDWSKILDVDVWVEAAKQIYFSLGPGFGTLMALSSYNKFHHNCRKDAIIAATVNYFASFISGLVIFAVLGYMATMQNVEVSDVATEGPGLVFIVYPEGLATMQFSALWSVLFFLMVITLGIDSTFGGLESVITGLCDEYPRVLRAHRGIFIGLLIIMIYLCSIPTTTYGGNHVIYLLESYGTSLSLLFIVSLETIIVCWIYGADKFCENLEEMYGERPSVCWRICWKYISPTILVLIFGAACSEELGKYRSLKNGDYTYPGWAPSAGLLMTGSSVCCVPIYAIYYIKTKTSGSFIQRIRTAIKPLGPDNNEEDDRGCYYGEDGTSNTNKIKEDNDVHLDTVI